MAHQVQSMFSVQKTPWHGLGVILDDAPKSEDAIVAAGLNWQVEQRDLYVSLKAEDVPLADEYAKKRLWETHKALVRSDNHAELAIVGNTYRPLQNEKAFAFFDPFVEHKLASYETAGSLRDGKVVWILARLNRDPLVIGKGDEVNKYLLLSNSHDGTMAVRVGFTPIRVVCANTLALSMRAQDSKLLRVTHSKQTAAKLDQIQQIVNAANSKFEATAEQYRRLAKKNIYAKDLEKYVDIVFKFSTTEESKRRANIREETHGHIIRLFETGRGSDLKTAKGTAWGLYNAVTEYLSYERGRSDETRLDQLWFGHAAGINKLALDEALALAS